MQFTHLALLLSALIARVAASSGDRSDVFQNCVFSCEVEQCNASHTPLPFSLRMTRWTCADDCKYACMHQITDRGIQYGEHIQQYYGKWPFWRLAGMQEPASVAFSMLNLLAHAQGAMKIREKLPNSHPMKSYYLLGAAIGMNSWIWSSVFHTRDLPSTEKWDYFSAALTILYALYQAVMRLFFLYPPPRADSSFSTSLADKKGLRNAWSLICTVTYLCHVTYLSLLPRFDYSYNIIFNLALGLAHNALWLVYSLPFDLIQRFPSRPKSYRPAFVNKAFLFVVLTSAATALEVFDFPPWQRMIDAHSLWHLATAPIAVLWYNFLIADALDDGWKLHKT